jgi:type III secretion protein L
MTLSKSVLIDKHKLAASSGVVACHEDFTALTEAGEIVRQAHRYSDSLRAEMEQRVEAARRAGYEAGERAAREDFSASMTATVAQMETAFARLETRIVNTVMGALQQILKQIDQRVVMEQLVRQLLAEARGNKRLRLRVCAEQFDEVNRWLSGVLADFAEVEFVDVLKDPAAAYGTCVLESEFGSVDASLDVQLAAVRRGLVSAFIDKRVAAAAGRE